MNEVLSPLAREGLLGVLLLASLAALVSLHRKFIAEKDARISDAQRMNEVFFTRIATLKEMQEKSQEDAERREEQARRQEEIRAIQDEAARERTQPVRERIPTGKHRPFPSGGGQRDGE